MNIKEIVEGMTAPQVAQVIKDNFNEVDKDKANKTDLNKSISDLASVVEANKTDLNKSISDLASVVEANKTDLTKKIDNNKEDTDEKLSELEVELGNYYTSEEVDEKFTETDAKLSELSEEIGIKLPIKSVAVHPSDSNVWQFDDVILKANIPYLIKLVSGEGNNSRLSIGSSSSENRLKTGEYVEISIGSTGKPYIFISGGVFTDAPVIELYSKDNYLINKYITPINNKIDSLNNDIQDAFISKAIAEGEFTYFFNGIKLINGETYGIRLVGEEFDNISLAVGGKTLSPKLKHGEWVTITATDSGTPFIYNGASISPKYPTLEVYNEDNLLIGDYILPNTNKLENIYIVKSKGVAPAGSTTYWFNNFEFKKGNTYRVRLLTEAFDDKLLAVGGKSLQRLSYGKWVVMEATDSGNPFIYDGVSISVNPPFIEIANIDNLILPKTNVINVSRDGQSKVGREIHFSGLNAIADAINSITDASESNRYVIHVEGEFHFTNPLDVTMKESPSDTSERSVIVMKPFVDIEGDGGDNSIIFIDFPENATFHNGLSFSDYQPVYFFSNGGNIKGMKIIGKNCRYTIHIDSLGSNPQRGEVAVINIENCQVISYGAPDYRPAGDMDCFGTGTYDGQKWNIKNCDIINYVNGNAFAVHPPLHYQAKTSTITFENCTFRGNIRLHNYQVSNYNFIEFVNCSFTKGSVPIIGCPYYNNNVHGNLGQYTSILVNGNNLRALYNADNLTTKKGAVLRVVSNSKGTQSYVEFNSNPSAFNIIVGNSSLDAIQKTFYGWDTQYGYVYRNGGANLSGLAFGTLDIDESSAGGKSLALRLGDCTTYTKTLVIRVDGVDYSVTFNEDYTSKDNQYIIDIINGVIGSVATADIYCPAELYYPKINGLCEVKSNDDGAILKGMAVVFENDGMRKAKNSDGYIDGICLDDTSLGQTGRVITYGYIYSARTWRYASAYDRPAIHISAGQSFGINPDNDGELKAGITPIIARCKSEDVLEILPL